MRYLRLYLIFKNNDNNLETKVHRDLEALVEEWIDQRGRNATGLIHVGFDCPEDDSVITLFDRFPRRLLVTESARWALPTEYSVFPVSVGFCGFDDGRKAVPTYFGTSGWGKVFSEREFKEIAESLYVNRPMSPWLKHIHDCNSELYLKLAHLDVVDDESFALVRNRMLREERLETERLRLEFLKEQVNADNLSEILSIAPESLLNSDLIELDLTVRLSNIFRMNNIVKVGDLRKYSLDSLSKLTNMGQKSLSVLTNLIWNALIIPKPPREATSQEKIGEKESTIIAGNGSKDTLISILEEELDGFNERERCIIKGRLGYGGTRVTLDQIGKDYSITRERVRQIESKITKIIGKKIEKRIVTKIKDILLIQKDPLDIDFLELEDNWFKGFLGRYEYLAGIVESFSNNELHIVKINGRSIVSVLSQEEWEGIVRESVSQLKTKGMLGWTRKEVEIFLEALANKHQVPELSVILKRQLEEKLLFAQQEHTDIYVGFGSQVDNLIIVVLMESEEPLHIMEISRRLKEKYHRDIKINQISNSTSGALLLGRGIYGLWKHIKIEQNEIDDIISSIERIVEADQRDKQWGSHELLDRLRNEKSDLPKELNPYLIEAFLSKSNKLVSLGRFLWTRKAGKEKAVKSRMDITQAYESILKQAGKPLDERALLKSISIHRSISANRQIMQRGNLIEISRGVWGLIDRDVPLSTERREKLLNTLVDILAERRKALHFTEIKNSLSGRKFGIPESLSEYTICRLAQNDPRIKIGKGQILGLSEWPDMGRMNISQAAREVMANKKRLSLNDIRERIENIIGRGIKNQQVASILQNLGATYDPDDKKYEVK